MNDMFIRVWDTLRGWKTWAILGTGGVISALLELDPAMVKAVLSAIGVADKYAGFVPVAFYILGLVNKAIDVWRDRREAKA